MKKLFLILFLLPIFASSQSWDYQKTLSHFEKLRLRNLTGTGINIFFLDLGCNNIGTEGEDAIWVNPTGGYNFYSDNSDYSESSNHGTVTMSQACRSSIAIAPNANGYEFKIADPNNSDDALIVAIDSILNFVDPVTGRGADIVNISGQFTTPSVLAKIDELVAADIVVFASAGNSTTDAETAYPAALTGVVAVTSYPYDGIVYHKNANAPEGGHGIDCAMGGRNTEGIYSNGTYGNANGTSFSAPLATGFMAIYLEQAYKNHSTRTRHEIKDYMLKRAVKQSSTNYFGRGYLTF